MRNVYLAKSCVFAIGILFMLMPVDPIFIQAKRFNSAQVVLQGSESEEWPLPGRNARRQAATRELILPPLTPLWEVTFPHGDLMDRAPIYVAAQGKLFVAVRSADSSRSLLTFDAETGTEIWYHGFVNGWSFDYVGYDEVTGRLYAATAIDILTFDPDDGSIVNQFPVPGGCGWTRFAISDGNLYVVACAKLSRIDQDGNVIWTYTDPYFAPGSGGFGTPSVGDGIVYVGSNSWTLQAVDANTGQKLWEAPTNGAPYTQPVIGDGSVFVGCQGQGTYPLAVIAYDATSGLIEWGVRTGYGGTVDVPMSYSDGVLYFGSADQNIYAIDTRTPKLLWRYNTPNDIDSPVVLMGSIVYATSAETLWALDAETGRLVGQQNIGAGGGLVPYEGKLFVNNRVLISGTSLQAFHSSRGFHIQVTPKSLVAMTEEQAIAQLSFRSTHDFTETLQLTNSPVPDGVNVNITPSQVLPSEVATVTVRFASTLLLTGNFTLTLTATSTSATESTQLNLFIARSRVFLPLVIK